MPTGPRLSLPCCAQEAAALPPAAPGSFQASGWAGMVELQPSTPDAAPAGPAAPSKRRRLVVQQPKASSAQLLTASSSTAPAQGWLPQAEQVVRHFDEQLGRALEAALDACSGTGQPPSAAGAGDKQPAGLAQTAASRATVLEPFVQDRCAAVNGMPAVTPQPCSLCA